MERFLKEFEELKEKMEKYGIMKSPAQDYHDILERINAEKEWFEITGILYRARGDEKEFRTNPGYAPIPHTTVRDMMQAALNTLEAKISACEEELKVWGFRKPQNT